MAPEDQTRRPFSGFSELDLEPSKVNSNIDVLLAQAESLERLGRGADREKKLNWAMAIATDCVATYPRSALAMLNGARVTMASGRLDFAARMIGAAQKLADDEITTRSVHYHESVLARQKMAADSQDAMLWRLIMYACQSCGRLTEFISVPCMCCGWRPRTLSEISWSGRLSTAIFSFWDLLSIGSAINSGRRAAEVVQNLAQVAADEMADPQSWYRKYVEDTFRLIQEEDRRFDNYYCIQPMSERLVAGDYDQLHHFIAAGVWDAAPVETELLVQADRLVGGDAAVLVIDDTAIPKKGTHSVGVVAQYASALGKTANCQTPVSLTLARGEAPVMLALRLFLHIELPLAQKGG